MNILTPRGCARIIADSGYARASLREIATNSEFSHGVVHYYFRDKLGLIVYCVRYYKAQCVRRYDAVVADSDTADELVEAFAELRSIEPGIESG